MTIRARSPFAMTFARCVRTAAAPTVLAALASLLAARWLARGDGTPDAPAAQAPWLHLPLFVAGLGCAITAATFWPLFARRRPGADWIVQRQRGPWRGNGAAVLGALSAQAVLTLPVALGLPPLLGAPGQAEVHAVLSPPPESLLRQPGQGFDLPVGMRLEAVELRLRPLAAPPLGPLQPTRLQVFATAGDEAMAPIGEATVEQTGQRLRVPFAARSIDTVRIVQTAGNVPVAFPAGSVVAIAATTRSTVANGLLASVLFLVPTFVALAAGVLCGRFAALPTVLGAIVVLLFVLTLAGAGPADDAIGQVLRGQWLLSYDAFGRSLPSLAGGALAMILATLAPPSPRP